MASSGRYQTRQGEQILAYLSGLNGKHVTADDVILHFESIGIRIGRATVYRHLDRLVQNGKVRKYTFENAQSACYQFVDNQIACSRHLHLKCKECGKLFHVEADILDVIADTLMKECAFEFDSSNTVFYGKCKECAQMLNTVSL